MPRRQKSYLMAPFKVRNIAIPFSQSTEAKVVGFKCRRAGGSEQVLSVIPCLP
jgi:hypothetical protein